MKLIRSVAFVSGAALLVFAFGYVFRLPFALAIWPWEDGRYSYLFIGSILAAISAALLSISWMGTLGPLPGGALNTFVIGAASAIYFFYLAAQRRTDLLLFGIFCALFALMSAAAFFWSHRLPFADQRPTPRLVRISFGIFAAALFLSAGALMLRLPIFPWGLNRDSSVIFGCIFLGDAFFFLYGLYRPVWGNAFGQLLSFLAYDLVLIVPFVGLLNTVNPEHTVSLIVYLAVLFYSGGLAVYYLFIDPQTRFGT